MENYLMKFLVFLFALIGNIFPAVSDLFKPALYSPCTPPIRYAIGAVDTRFNLSQEKLIKHLDASSDIWEEALGRQVFVYDPEGTISHSKRLITVNMVYDERQQLNTKIRQIEGHVRNENKKYQTNISDYERRVKEFNDKSVQLSEKIKNLDINDPEYSRKFNEVYQESQELNRETDVLNQMAAELNQSTQGYNQEVARLNNTVNKYNQLLEEKPEEGLYRSDNDTIEVYLTATDKELVHTLAHEFGHALGIEHIQNPEAIMYPKSSEYLKTTSEDMSVIQNACKERELK